MQRIAPSLLCIAFFVCSCSKYDDSYICDFDTSVQSWGSVIEDSLSDHYFGIWKTLLKEMNNMSEEDYNEHITKTAISSDEWDAGITVVVNYIVNIDWIDIKCQDKFVIRMNSDYSPYQYLNIPRDVFFDQSQIEFNIAHNADSEISMYNLDVRLKYDNCREVCRAAERASGYKEIRPDYVSFYVPGNVPRENGDPYMMMSGTIDESENRCLTGKINLVTGECDINETVCIIYFCFKEGTQIARNNGRNTSIENIKAGDTILSVNRNTMKIENDVVERVDSVIHNTIVHIVFSDMTTNDNTFDHPYYVKGKGWCSYRPLETIQKYDIDAKQLQIGDTCYKYLNKKLTEVQVSTITENIGDVLTYNISRLKRNKNFFANGILVSNESD